MAAKTRQEAITEISAYVQGHDSGHYGWYVGITKDPQTRLFDDHNVNRDAAWIWLPTTSAAVARSVEAYFIAQPSFRGGSGGGDAESVNVYAYRITDYTVEST